MHLGLARIETLPCTAWLSDESLQQAIVYGMVVPGLAAAAAAQAMKQMMKGMGQPGAPGAK